MTRVQNAVFSKSNITNHFFAMAAALLDMRKTASRSVREQNRERQVNKNNLKFLVVSTDCNPSAEETIETWVTFSVAGSISFTVEQLIKFKH